MFINKIKVKTKEGVIQKMNQKKQRGITLIALVITIIVLLILAGVTINMVLGDDGIIGQAQAAKTAHENAEDDYYEKETEALLKIDNIRKQQEGKESSVNFNNGYLTNVTTKKDEAEIVAISKDEILADLPEGYSIDNLTSDGNVKNGSTIMNANGKKVGTVIIYGDIYEDGLVDRGDLRDLTRIQNLLLRQEAKDLEPYQIISMDINNDQRVDENDLTTMNEFMADFENINIEQNRKALNPNDITVVTRKDKIDEYMKKIPSTFEKEWYIESNSKKYYKVKLGGEKISLSSLNADYVKIYDATGTEITTGEVGAGSYIEISYSINNSKCVVFE